MKTDEIEKLLAEATPGPWIVRTLENFGWNIVHYLNGDKFKIYRVSKSNDEADARLIAMAPDLAAEVVRLRAERDEWQSRAEFAEAQLEAVQDILPPEAGLLKKRLAEKRAALEGRKGN